MKPKSSQETALESAGVFEEGRATRSFGQDEPESGRHGNRAARLFAADTVHPVEAERRSKEPHEIEAELGLSFANGTDGHLNEFG